MKNFTKPSLSHVALAVAALCASTSSYADIDFAKYPAGSAYRTPIPNVILSIDDSGSMGWTDEGAETTNNSLKRITKLKNGLKSVLTDTSKYDGKFRLAWQSMWRCNNIPSSQSACDSKNAIGEFSGSHKADFKKWVDTLTADGGTPSHTMMWNAGEYLKTTGANSPWNTVPGTDDGNKAQACRRAYHIFMTDGGWNSYLPDTSFDAFGFQDKILMTSVGGQLSNADGTAVTLPDDTIYNTESAQTAIYRDDFGSGFINRNGACIKYSPNGKCDTYEKLKQAYPTLSDMAFHYWATDLQPNITNSVVFEPKKSADETFSAVAKDKTTKTTTFTPYWNPRNDPATWQHMVTYSIGYGARASNWTNGGGNPRFASTDNGFVSGMYGTGFAEAATGVRKWIDAIDGVTNVDLQRPEELWHMAINSRGKFYPVATGDDLAKAFDEIFSTIVADNTNPLTSFASTSSTNVRSSIGEFISGYEATNWTGYIRSDVIAKSTGVRSANAAWGINEGAKIPLDRKTTADKLDATTFVVANRLVLTTNFSSGSGISFEWNNALDTAQKTILKDGATGNSADTVGQNRLNFLRGDRTLEGETTAAPFRKRGSRQGDIVNSQVWYVAEPASNFSYPGYAAFTKANLKREPMIYVGGNDGMLHGFSALNGDEKIAFIPRGVFANLPALSKAPYTHQYYVDGSPFTADVFYGSSNATVGAEAWRTYLIGSLGAGGKGYYVLDVTKPGTTDNSIATNFAKGSASELVVLDKTYHVNDAAAKVASAVESDIGHIFSTPVVDDTNSYKSAQVAKMNNGQWAAVMGNGYNSAKQRPVLLIQFLDKVNNNYSLMSIVATGAVTSGVNVTENGLSTPRLVDINGDGTPDVVYAGDLKGNLWKFDVSSASASNWGVSFDGKPLYTAQYTSGSSSTLQAITTAPLAKANDRVKVVTKVDGSQTSSLVGGMMVSFGTGRNLTEGDRTDATSVNTIYSVLDATRYKIVNGKVTIDTSGTAAAPVPTGRESLVGQAVATNGLVAGSGGSAGRDFWKMTSSEVNFSNKKGWYIDLPVDGERLLKNASFYDGSNILQLFTQVPASGGNSVEETCTPSPKEEKQYLTLINIMDGARPKTQVMDSNGDGFYNAADQQVSRMAIDKGAQSISRSRDKVKISSGGGGKLKDPELAQLPVQPMRPSWRQIQ